ncbi:FAD/NAD(P)-binding domain-containing protein [Exidia glandulosa HHB12029]|uniref:FAD/NAD(P)-binding domain-containing protein n=1 Tax=Exidia glandulosa HHB12029 TaxID=1314781 RepID=A0A165D1P6_EXIGL|nr:FAD/NAD(P)-binding domain-containing protein [Exidia glandulosa HHB12029]
MSLPSNVDVVIVGAGPSGLACALALAHRKVPFVIVDALSEGHNGSRAALLQANALEALEAVHPSLASELVAAGTPSVELHTVDIYERQLFKVQMSANAPYTRYPFSLLIAQHDIERLMRTYLSRGGNDVQWKKRVTDVKETDEGRYELAFESGEKVKARYVVAADGSKSTIRTFANIRFLDPTTNAPAEPSPDDPSFVVADVLFASPLPPNIPRDTLRMMITPEGVILTAPLKINHSTPSDTTSSNVSPDGNLFRLYLAVPTTPPSRPDAAYLQGIINARGPGSHLKDTPEGKEKGVTVPKIERVLDSGRYRTRPALAERYVTKSQSGAHILLVGDAAHKHGPAGGQGMNLGICDGCAAADAIARENPSALNARRAIAAKVIAMVENMTDVERGGSGWVPWFRVGLLRLAFRVPFVNSLIAWQISGLVYVRPKGQAKA